MIKKAWTIYNEHQRPEDLRFFSTKKSATAEYKRIFKGMPSLKKLVKMTSMGVYEVEITYKRK